MTFGADGRSRSPRRAWSKLAWSSALVGVLGVGCGKESGGDGTAQSAGGSQSAGGAGGSAGSAATAGASAAGKGALAGAGGSTSGNGPGGVSGGSAGAAASVGGSAGGAGKAQGGSSAGGTGGATAGSGATEPEAGASGDAGAPSGTGVRGVTNAEVVFEGTETSLDQYNVYHQGGGSTDFVSDPAGAARQVLRFERPKSDDWTHEMVRLLDKRTGYEDAAQVTEWESAYHYKQQMYVPNDPQYSSDFVNLLEDFHCEPCEANDLQIYTSYVAEDSVCIWIAYSTDEAFDPRGPDRGSSTDPWDALGGDNRLELWLNADGTPNLPATMPPTGSLLLCRDDLHVSDLFERWVDVEMLVKVSSFDSGSIKFWIDDKPFFFDGPNAYRYNQTGDGSSDALPVNVFQWGLYMGAADVMAGTPDSWVLYATPPRLEVGDDILYSP